MLPFKWVKSRLRLSTALRLQLVDTGHYSMTHSVAILTEDRENHSLSRLNNSAKGLNQVFHLGIGKAEMWPRVITVHIGFCDYGLSGQSGFNDCKPLDGRTSFST